MCSRVEAKASDFMVPISVSCPSIRLILCVGYGINVVTCCTMPALLPYSASNRVITPCESKTEVVYLLDAHALNGIKLLPDFALPF